MKKKLLYLLSLLLFSAFVACHDDDENDPIPEPEPTPTPLDVAYAVEGQYEVTTIYLALSSGLKDTMAIEGLHISKTAEGLVKIKTPFMEIGTDNDEGYLKLGPIIIDSIPVTANGEIYNFEIKDSPNVKTSNFKNPIATINGSVSGKIFTATLTLKNEEHTVTFIFNGQQVRNNECQLLSIVIDDKAIATEPEKNGNTITFYVTMDTDMDQLQFAPIITLSKGAISNPASGEMVDFSKAENQTTKYTIISEDLQIKNEYNIVIKKGTNVAQNSFEEWTIEDNANKFYKPQGVWSTSNAGITSIKNFGQYMGVNYEGGAIVLAEDNGVNGKAAKIVTANTIGGESIMPGLFPSIPKITSGSLFLGDFVVDVSNTLNSTQFGIPYFQKPSRVKGYYKYTPGSKYYYCKDPSKSNEAEEDNTKSDQCAISAVLYEVSNFDEFLNGENIFTSDKIVAIAQKFSGEVTDFTEFELKLEYKKEYKPQNKYRFAVIFSSSKDGDKFSGAENSTLIIDEVIITNE